ncbi:MAG TPA: hypothetical protein VNE39_08360 [Planctomycetota bacterium]|nr:hypothetical protein [Planctomycetota bacterium]
MNPNRLAIALTVVVGLAASPGCVAPWTRPEKGPVVSVTPHRWGSAPDITFLDQAGRLRSLSSFYADATLAAFIEQPCSAHNEPLAAAAAKLRGRVAVVEICTTAGGCKEHDQCVMRRGDRAKSLISLCDGTGLVRQWFGVATKNALFVLDLFGSIVARGTLADLDRLARKADAMAAEVEEQRLYAY